MWQLVTTFECVVVNVHNVQTFDVDADVGSS